MGNKTEKPSIAIYRISGPPLDCNIFSEVGRKYRSWSCPRPPEISSLKLDATHCSDEVGHQWTSNLTFNHNSPNKLKFLR